MPFLPRDYSVPSTSKYMRLKEGENVFRILSDAVTGYEYWNTDNKPVRLRENPRIIPKDARPNKFGDTVRHFWAMKVWNYEERRVQVLEITQPSIQEKLKRFIDNGKWGDPVEYDFIIEKKVEGEFTKYDVSTNPKEMLSEEIATVADGTKVNLDALFTGGDPFDQDSPSKPQNYPTEPRPDDIPF